MKNIIIKSIILFSFISITAYAETTPIEKKRIAVFEFAANNVPLAYAKIARNSIEVALFSMGDFQLLEKERIDRIQKERMISNPSLADSDKMIMIGKTLTADFIILGSIEKIEEYKLTVRVVALDTGKILILSVKNFGRPEDIDPIADKLGQKIADILRKYIKTGKHGSSFYYFQNLLIGPMLNYNLPSGYLTTIVNPGFGVSISLQVDNIFLNNAFIGLNVGFNRFSGKDNSSDSCNLIPLMAETGYKFYPARRLYLMPVLSAGASFINIRHGSGSSGFNIPENSEMTLIEPLLSAGGFFGISIENILHIQTGLRYMALIEKTGLIDFYSISLGVLFYF